MKLQNAAAPLMLRKKKRESVKESLKDLHLVEHRSETLLQDPSSGLQEYS